VSIAGSFSVFNQQESQSNGQARLYSRFPEIRLQSFGFSAISMGCRSSLARTRMANLSLNPDASQAALARRPLATGNFVC